MPSEIEHCECGGGLEESSNLESSVCSNHFKDIELTSSTSIWKNKNRNTADIMLSESRQEFIPGEPTLSYERKGGIFITNAGIVVCLLGTVGLCFLVGILVHLYYPTVNIENQKVEDDLSWDIGKLHIRDSDDKVRLLTHVTPTYYRLKIKPNYVNNTFEGNVTISLITHKSNVKHISLHAKDLDIENTTIVLTEQMIIIDSVSSNVSNSNQPKNKTKRYADFEAQKQTPGGSGKTMQNEDEFKVINNLPKPLTTTPPPSTTSQVKRFFAHKNRTATTDESMLSGNDTRISKIKKRTVLILKADFNKDLDRLILALESHLTPGVNYTLAMSFKGKMDKSLTGFYRSDFQTSENKSESLFVTQFEPISARKAFPCFDEPIFKAMFEISIARPVNSTAISNMPLIEEEPIPGEDLVWSHFERSQPMSPYLVAYAVSNLEPIDVPLESNTDLELKIWARKELKEQTKYATEVIPRILEFYENYFGLPYALPKLDLLGIPDFAVGAMENWGMMTFRETSLLLDPKSNSLKVKKSIAMVIAHELAHQWFGNLVTMQWWTDVWLNEGFATYLEYIAVNAIEPSWDLLEQFLLDRMAIMASDSLETTRPVSNPINDEIEISQVFDDISYMKAASLLRMLNHVLTEDIFHNGIVEYMNKWQYKNADQSVLWEVITSATNETFLPNTTITAADFMNSWTLQAGYPVINVTRNYELNTVTVTQNRFYIMTPPGGMTNELWYVPISYIVGNVSQDFWNTTPKEWLDKKSSITIQLPEGSNATELYFNVHGIGHYRVNYDKKNWKKLQYELEDQIDDYPVPTRAQLLDDAFNLARAGQLEYSVALDLTKHMIGREMEMLPWYAVLDNLDYIHRIMQRSNEYSSFQEYISRLIMPTLEKFGFDNKPNDTAQDLILRDHLTYWACMIEEDQCLEWAWTKFNAWRNQSDPDKVNPIPHNNRNTIYATILRLGTQKEYNFMYERYINSNDPEVQTETLGCLTHTKYPWILNNLFNYSITTMDLQLVPILWSSIEDEIASTVGFEFILNNWPRVFAKLSMADDQIIQTLVESAFGWIHDEQRLRQFKRFVQAHKEDLKAASHNIHKSLEQAVLAIHWKKTKMEEVEKWLVKFKNSNTNDVNDLSTL